MTTETTDHQMLAFEVSRSGQVAIRFGPNTSIIFPTVDEARKLADGLLEVLAKAESDDV